MYNCLITYDVNFTFNILGVVKLKWLHKLIMWSDLYQRVNSFVILNCVWGKLGNIFYIHIDSKIF